MHTYNKYMYNTTIRTEQNIYQCVRESNNSVSFGLSVLERENTNSKWMYSGLQKILCA